MSCSKVVIISIIIPAYNHEHFIEARLRSIWDQAYNDMEIIVIDDGSSDRTFHIASQLQRQSPVPMRVFQQTNHGLTSTLNKGLALCSGEYVAVIASDDMFMQQRFDQQLARLEADPLVQVVWSNGVTWTDGVPGSRMHQPSIIHIFAKKSPGDSQLYLYQRLYIFHPNSSVQKIAA